MCVHSDKRDSGLGYEKTYACTLFGDNRGFWVTAHPVTKPRISEFYLLQLFFCFVKITLVDDMNYKYTRMVVLVYM